MKKPKNTDNSTKNTSLAPLRVQKSAGETKLRRLTDEEIIRGFRYLMNKDKKDE